MNRSNVCVACGVAAAVFLVAAYCPADPPAVDPTVAAIAELAGMPQMLELPVRVVDAAGKPVAKAKVSPWALRSSQGHGWWIKDDPRAGIGPQDVFTDDTGAATVLYPKYRDRQERTTITQVSLHVDHPDFAYLDALHIDVPLETSGPQPIELTRGVRVEVHPTLGGEPVDLDEVFAIWSDGRSWEPESSLQKMPEGILRIPAMSPGDNSVLLVRLDGDRATHFSKITDFKLEAGEPKQIDIPLRPALRLTGVLSDNVPRPVRAGRIKIETLSPTAEPFNRVSWLSWVPIQEDGTFTIDAWPEGEPLQLIALCEGYIATSGKAPDCVKNPRDPDPYHRPQVFDPRVDRRIEVAMMPLVGCTVTTVDEDEKPVAGIAVHSWPNVGWWNWGSQVYGHPLVRGERLLRIRDYHKAYDDAGNAYPPPFRAETDASGAVTLQLPARRERLAIGSDVYELPVFLGRRDVQIDLTTGEAAEVTLRLQSRGTDKLGEWDKLAGVVFGCSTREGRRICALPGVRKQMDEFEKRFREAKNQRDPQLLSEAYTAVADAFDGVGDVAEAAKWRAKAAEQAVNAKAAATN